jgi:hypothetical protein
VAGSEQAVPPPRGERCVRARELADRRAAGDELSDYDGRLLDSHLAGCEACTAYVAQLAPQPLQDAVPGGEKHPARARVGVVEDEGRQGVGASEPPDGEIRRPEQPLTEHEQREPSTVDAMGKDKRRQVVGQSYGPTRQRQLAYYGIFVAFIVVLFVVGSYAIGQLDKAPSKIQAQAPWAQPNAPQDPLGGFSTDNRGGVTHFQ